MANIPFVAGFQDIDKTKNDLVGGKGMNLGELARIPGIRVPDGFCISTEAFKRIIAATPALGGLLDRLSLLKGDDREQVRTLSSDIRQAIEGTAIPTDIVAEIERSLSELGEQHAYAIRSSATAEDLPDASFAGQQDTYLNIIGKAAILKHVSQCWASLYTEWAIIYRIQHHIDHRSTFLAVVVQRMVFPTVAGILFTADPVSANRKISSIDASFGLGEALVSGRVNADVYKVRGGKVISRKISAKKMAIYAIQEGGTKEQAIEQSLQNRPALTNAQVLELERIGRQLEAHFGCPQDIEWCLVKNTFYIVQSRPITTLYPVPEAGDTENHVYVSVGHNQMMTDALKPLGLSFFQLTTARPMNTAGGRLFVDVTPLLASPGTRKKIIDTFGQADPLLKDAMMTVVRRKDFIRPAPADNLQSPAYIEKVLPWSYLAPFENNPAIVADLIRENQMSVAALKENIQTKSGAAVFDFILEDMQASKAILFNPKSWEVIKVAMYASSWVNKKMNRWLGEKNVADILSQSVSNNITSEMGLELMAVADVIRPYPQVITYLQQAQPANFWEQLLLLEGGQEASNAIQDYLHKYGMRCAGEIDITRPRWMENPVALVPVILNNIRNFEPGAGQLKFEKGKQEAWAKSQELSARLMLLPGGKRKARETQRMIRLIRDLIGYREYPKYGIINRYFIYRQALMKEAEKLVQAGVLREKEDSCYLTFEEFRAAVHTGKTDDTIISNRKAAFKQYEKLTPPRVITSDGEIIAGKYKTGPLPNGALAGLAVSSGVVEGRARVILNMEDANMEEGDILVTSFTDPSWTPLFVSIKGLVTEVGGLMTHGAVIAREYGLLAVVGVEHATRLIKDGQRIRVHGTEGYVEILEVS